MKTILIAMTLMQSPKAFWCETTIRQAAENICVSASTGQSVTPALMALNYAWERCERDKSRLDQFVTLAIQCTSDEL